MTIPTLGRVMMVFVLAAVLGSPETGRADGCVGACAADGHLCVATANVEARRCRADCAGGAGEDALACRTACRVTARQARQTCKVDFTDCTHTCNGNCASCALDLAACAQGVAATLRGCAPGCGGDATCLDGCATAAATGRDACQEASAVCRAACGGARATIASTVEVIPPETVTALPGQTVYLTYVLVNHGPTTTFHYTPSFLVQGAARVRSVSGAPSSSGQTLSHNARKSIKVAVQVQPAARGGTITVVGVFAFTEPEVVTVRTPGVIAVRGLPMIVARCHTQLVGDHSVVVTVEVENQGAELVKAVRATRAVTESEHGARFTVTSGRSPSVVYRLAPGERTQFTFGGGWNERGTLHIFEGATATTRLNQPIASELVECQPPIVAP